MILYLVQDDKYIVHVGRLIPLSDVAHQSTRAIVGQYQIVITADNYWNAEKSISSVTLRMNITEIAGKYLYSGGPNGLRRIFFLVNSITTDGSTGLKHIVNAYEALINLSIKSSSVPYGQFIQPLTYHMHFEADGSVDHRGTHFSKPGCVSWSFLSGEHGHSYGK